MKTIGALLLTVVDLVVDYFKNKKNEKQSEQDSLEEYYTEYTNIDNGKKKRNWSKRDKKGKFSK